MPEETISSRPPSQQLWEQIQDLVLGPNAVQTGK